MAQDAFSWIGPNGGWGVAANWADVTSGATPAVVFPVGTNAVTIGGPSGEFFQLITGNGAASSLTLLGNTDFLGIVGAASLTIGDASTLTRAIVGILPGSTLLAQTASLADGVLNLQGGAGATALLNVVGTLILGGTGSLGDLMVVGADARVQATSGFWSNASVYVDPLGAVEIGGTGSATLGAITVDTGATLTTTTSTAIDATVINNGTIRFNGGPFRDIAGRGEIDVGTGVVQLYGSIAPAQTIVFAPSSSVYLSAAAINGETLVGYDTATSVQVGTQVSDTTLTQSGSVANLWALALSNHGTQVGRVALVGNYAGDRVLVDQQGNLTLIGPIVPGPGGPPSAGTSAPDTYVWKQPVGGGDWNTVANWTDTTAGTTTIAPGVNNIVQISGPFLLPRTQLLTGRGQAAALSFLNETNISGSIGVAGLVSLGTVVGFSGTAALVNLMTGASLTAGALALLDGTLAVTGASVGIAGTVTIGSTANAFTSNTVSVTDGGTLRAAGLVGTSLGFDSIAVDPYSVIEIGTLGTGAAGTLTIDPGNPVTGGLLVSGPVLNNGTFSVLAVPSATSVSQISLVNGLLLGSGQVRIGPGSGFYVGTIAATQTIVFDGAAGQFNINPTNGATGEVVSGFVQGDVIVTSGNALTDAVYSASSTPGIGTLTLSHDGTVIGSLTMLGDYSSSAFLITPDQTPGKTDITVTPTSNLGAGGTVSPGGSVAHAYQWRLNGTGGDWSYAANWFDLTVGAVARIAPGGADTVTIQGSGNLATDLVSGAGRAGTLGLFNAVALRGSFTVLRELDVGTRGTLGVATTGVAHDVIALLPGSVVTAPSANLQGNTVLSVDGPGTGLAVAGTLSIGGPTVAGGRFEAIGYLDVVNSATVQVAQFTVLDQAEAIVTIDSTGVVEIGTLGRAAVGALTVDPGISLGFRGSVTGTLVNNGTVVVGANASQFDRTNFFGPISGTGTIVLTGSSNLRVAGAVDAGQTIVFTGAKQALEFDPAASPSATILGFGANDSISFASLPSTYGVGGTSVVTGFVFSQTATNAGLVTLFHDRAVVGTLNLSGSLAGGVLVMNPGISSGNDLTLISNAVACFARGTRILTDRGEVAVEALRDGDRVATLLGRRMARIAWIGRRRIDIARHPEPMHVAPIRVRKNAFCPGVPHRDVLLSGEHALLVHDVLVPVRHLIDGVMIAREPAVGCVEYVHIQLDRHDVLVADGLPAESWLDTGNVGMFENAPHPWLHARFAVSSDPRACRPMLTEGPALVALRARLSGRGVAAARCRPGSASASRRAG